MTQPTDLAKNFLELHRKGEPLLLANAWDAGSAHVLESLDYDALATTSSGHAGTLGRKDGTVTRDNALDHCRELVGATRLPVSADLENCFAQDVEGVAETLRLAGKTGLAGCSIEDYSGGEAARIYPLEEAAARVRAAAAAAHGGANLILTARAENPMRCGPCSGDQTEPAAVVAHPIDQHPRLCITEPAAARIYVAQQHNVVSIQFLRRLRKTPDRNGSFLHKRVVGL